MLTRPILCLLLALAAVTAVAEGLDLKRVEVKQQLPGPAGNKFGSIMVTLPREVNLENYAVAFTVESASPAFGFMRVQFYNSGSEKPCLGFASWQRFGDGRPHRFFLKPYMAAQWPWYWRTVGLEEQPPVHIDRMEITVGSGAADAGIEAVLTDVRAVPFAFPAGPAFPYAERPAAVVHPCGFYTASDVERARKNVKLHPWAQKLVADYRARWEPLMSVPVSELVPDGDLMDCVYCPECEGGDDSFVPNDDCTAMKCRYCGAEFPSKELAEDTTVEVLPGVFRQCHTAKKNMMLGDDNLGNRYFLSMRLNKYKFQRTFQLNEAAYVYAVTGDKTYAAKVREVLLAIAERYPRNLLTFRTSFYLTPRFNYMAGRVGGWKYGDSEYVQNWAEAYDLTLSSGLYSDADKVKIENGVFREYLKMITAHRPNADVTSNAVPSHLTGAAICAAMLGDKQLMEDYVLYGESGLVPFLKKDYVRDGTWCENSASYTEMSNVPLVGLMEIVSRYGMDKSLYRNVFSNLGYMLMPGKVLPPVNDSNFRQLYKPEFAEAAYRQFPTPRNLALLERSIDAGSGTEYSLFKRDAQLPPVDPAERAYFGSIRIVSGTNWAILRPESDPDNTALVFDYGFYPNGHSHNSALNYCYYAGGDEAVFDYGYLGWAHPLRDWQVSPLAHNNVTIDGQVPKTTREGNLLFFGGNKLVQAVSAESSNAFDGCSTLQRTMFLISRADGHHYVVDFVRTRGGSRHMLTVHPVVPERAAANAAAAVRPDWGAPRATGAEWMRELSRKSCAGNETVQAGRVAVAESSGRGMTAFEYEVPALRNRRRPEGREVHTMYAFEVDGGASDFAGAIDSGIVPVKVEGDGAAVRCGNDLIAVKYSGKSIVVDGIKIDSDLAVMRDGKLIFRSAPDVHGEVLAYFEGENPSMRVDFDENGVMLKSKYVFFDGRRDAACRILKTEGDRLFIDPAEGIVPKVGDTFTAYTAE
ncbi:MAG: heparinase II/III family protein [Victivallaceae bacterium]|nr:heparinase II/III family protein [Victivallaceae bacterium]